MPVLNNTNNRILPTNTRAVDVAKDSIDRITGIQSKRYDNAFQVQGFQSVLYTKLNCGLTCLCQTKASKVPKSILDENGDAGPGVINHLLTGQHFGTLPYGAVPKSTAGVFGPMVGGGGGAGIARPPEQNVGMFDEDEPPTRRPFGGSPGTGFIEDDEDFISNSDVVIEDGFADVGPVSGEGTLAQEMFDTMLGTGMEMGFDNSSDVACPICFGTGYVSGFSVYNGVRIVLEAQALDVTVIGNAMKDLDVFVPTLTGKKITFAPTVLPRGAIGVDSLSAYSGPKVCPAKIYVDGISIVTEANLIPFCDGRPHVFAVELENSESSITHLEIQYNQSLNKTLFEFPKLSMHSQEAMIENTEPFQIVMSPVIPNVTTGDIICDSTYGKVFQITSSNWWNDKRRAVLGWECQVRPCQPQELYSILPRRKPIASPNTPARVTPNTDKRY